MSIIIKIDAYKPICVISVSDVSNTNMVEVIGTYVGEENVVKYNIHQNSIAFVIDDEVSVVDPLGDLPYNLPFDM